MRQMLIMNDHGTNPTWHATWRISGKVQAPKWTMQGCWLQSSDWMYALLITACSQHLSVEVIRVTVGLHLHSSPCESHPCLGGAMVTSRGINGLSCKSSSSHFTRHHQVNDAIWRALKRADVPATKEPTGLLRSDGKRLLSRRFDPGAMAKWTQPHMGRHNCEPWPASTCQPHQWHLEEWQCSISAEESKVHWHHSVAYFRSHSHRDSGTNQYGRSTLPRQTWWTPFFSFWRFNRNHLYQNVCLIQIFNLVAFHVIFLPRQWQKANNSRTHF